MSHSPVVIAFGVWFDGTPRDYRTAPSKTAAVRWLRANGWKVASPALTVHPREAGYAERGSTQEWARILNAPSVEDDDA